MRIQLLSLASVLCMIGSGSALAQDTSPTSEIRLSHGLTATSNALDDSTGLSDVYGRLAIAAETSRNIGSGKIAAGISAEATAFRRYTIENDQRLRLALGYDSDPSAPVSISLKGGYQIFDEGDNIEFPGFRLGKRTLTETFDAGAVIAFKRDNGGALRLAISDTFERVGASRFDTGFADERLSPDRNRLQVAAGYSVDEGTRQYGVAVEGEKVTLQREVAVPVSVAYKGAALRGRYALTTASGLRIGGEAGIRTLDADGDLITETRPVFLVEVAAPVGERLQLKGGLSADFNTEDTDDPLADYRRRVTADGSFKFNEMVTLSAGAFYEHRDNILLGNEQYGGGGYLALTHQPREGLAFLVRLDGATSRTTVLDLREKTLAVTAGIEARL